MRQANERSASAVKNSLARRAAKTGASHRGALPRLQTEGPRVIITADTLGLAWRQLLATLLAVGQPSSPRGTGTREILGLQFRIPNLRDNILAIPSRNLNYRFMVAEWLWMQTGRRDLAPLTRFNSRMAQFSDDGRTLAGAYGPKITDQLFYVAGTLARDRDSRQAVLNIWKENPGRSKDIPCTLSMQFLIRGGRLHQIVSMRSSDAWLGIPYDVFSFGQIGNVLCGDLGVEAGSLTINAGSSHLYAHDVAAATAVLATDDKESVVSHALSGEMPSFKVLGEWLDGIFDSAPRPSWAAYHNVLRCPNAAAALEYLRHPRRE